MTPYPVAGPFVVWARLREPEPSSRPRTAWLPERSWLDSLGCLTQTRPVFVRKNMQPFSVVDGLEVEFRSDSATCTFSGLVGTVGAIHRATLATAFGWYARPGEEP
jgi:hypothetical protein